MKFFFASFLVPLLVLAAPSAEPEEGSGLEIRAKEAQTCKIINVNPGSHVNCRYWPHLSSSSYLLLGGGQEFKFECWTEGDCYDGNCTWDKVFLYGDWCLVNGAFTSANCSRKKLPKCNMPKKRDHHVSAPIDAKRDSHMPALIEERDRHAPAPAHMDVKRNSHRPEPIDAEG